MHSWLRLLLSQILLLLVVKIDYTESHSQPQARSLIPEQLGRLELEQFQLELDDFIREQRLEAEARTARSARVKRTVIYNGEAAMNVVLLMGIPISIMLPVLTNVFTNLNWSKLFKWKRSVDEPSPSEVEIEYVEESSIVQPYLDKIRGYFELMMIREPSCQERAVCELSADPVKYYPVSELVLSSIRNCPSQNVPNRLTTRTALTLETNRTNIVDGRQKQSRSGSLFGLYSEAADKGLAIGEQACLSWTRSCPHSIEQRLDMRALRFWQLLSSLLRFNIRDTLTT